VLDSIDFLVSLSKDGLAAFLHSNEDFTDIKETETAVEGVYKSHFLVKLYASEDEKFYSRLVETTGSEEHVKHLKELLQSEIPNLASEEAIYEKAGLTFIPAVRREGLN